MSTKILNRWLNNPIYFRCGFFLIITLIIVLYFLKTDHDQIYIFFLIATIFFGIGFNNKSVWFLIINTTFIVAGRFIIDPRQWNLQSILIFELTYLLIMFISVELMKRTQKIKKDNLELIQALSKALDSRDTYTSHHSQNVAHYAVEIAKRMNLSKKEIDIIYKGGLLHDIGKIGIPEYVLLKPGRLTKEEYSIIKRHPVIGYEMIKHVSEFKEKGILEIVLHHHERYDGLGYPKGLVEEQIPLGARILAIADTYDAMTSKRIYRSEIDLESTLKEIEKNKGSQFDPEITDVFLSLFENQNHLNRNIV
ncbi:HD-GYP domain-containing protein [Neobacillus mesonae]|uniref:HD-GYP domain-containing protein n=1 Tax=Neobacillus mesonae TaxID=1193713 RepID=UPI00203C6327|nr:HD-GYP domain-containing protein [Neobacillus mesonae]MCM3570120.1 HD-GYP domain-containing protein [Neobacillus mesonae]